VKQRVILLAGIFAASFALWGSAARSHSTQLEQVQWASTEERERLLEGPKQCGANFYCFRCSSSYSELIFDGHHKRRADVPHEGSLGDPRHAVGTVESRK
jgi:hypothetical protein